MIDARQQHLNSNGVEINGKSVTGVQINDKLIIGFGARCFITKSVHYKFKPIKVISRAFTPNIVYTFAINRVACDAQNPRPRGELKRNNATRWEIANFPLVHFITTIFKFLRIYFHHSSGNSSVTLINEII